MAISAALLSSNGTKKGEKALPAAIFDHKVKKSLLHEAVSKFLTNQREGNAHTKTRAEVSGGGRKPWKQKHTGNARSGSNRSPLWRKGGIVFGPRKRKYYYDMPREKMRQALFGALTQQAQDSCLFVIESIPIQAPKTRDIAAFVRSVQPASSILLVTEQPSEVLKKACRNLRSVKVIEVRKLNPYLVLRAQKIIFVESAVTYLENLVQPSVN